METIVIFGDGVSNLFRGKEYYHLIIANSGDGNDDVTRTRENSA